MLESWPVAVFGIMALVLMAHAVYRKTKELLAVKVSKYQIFAALLVVFFISGLFYKGLFVQYEGVRADQPQNGFQVLCQRVGLELERASKELSLDKKTVRKCGCMFRIENKKNATFK